jgi:hypothetical protein
MRGVYCLSNTFDIADQGHSGAEQGSDVEALRFVEQ